MMCMDTGFTDAKLADLIKRLIIPHCKPMSDVQEWVNRLAKGEYHGHHNWENMEEALSMFGVILQHNFSLAIVYCRQRKHNFK